MPGRQQPASRREDPAAGPFRPTSALQSGPMLRRYREDPVASIALDPPASPDRSGNPRDATFVGRQSQPPERFNRSEWYSVAEEACRIWFAGYTRFV